MALRHLNVEEALEFLDLLKLEFSDRPHVYNNFLDIMKDFKHHSIDVSECVQRAAGLVWGHPKLIEGFSKFLPLPWAERIIQMHENNAARIADATPTVVPGRQLRVVYLPQDYKQDHLSPAEVQFRKNEIYCASSFQEEVEHRFEKQPVIHKQILLAMKELYHPGIESPEAMQYVGYLLNEHPEPLTMPTEIDRKKEIEMILPEKDSGGDGCTDKQSNITIHLPDSSASNCLDHEIPNSLPMKYDE